MKTFVKYTVGCLIIIALIYGGYLWLVTEHYQATINESYKVVFSIKPDEGFLDGQDDYSFQFYQNDQSTVSFNVLNCPSRCWVISQSKADSTLLWLHGCHKNIGSDYQFEIDFKARTATQIDHLPEDRLLLDTLTNLYVDQQLPLDYHY